MLVLSLKSFLHTERHISIQARLEDLEMLADLTGGEFRASSSSSSSWLGPPCSRTVSRLFPLWLSSAGRKSCPLCPEDKFKACYSHKLRRHLQNLHWKVYVEFEGRRVPLSSAERWAEQLRDVLLLDRSEDVHLSPALQTGEEQPQHRAGESLRRAWPPSPENGNRFTVYGFLFYFGSCTSGRYPQFVLIQSQISAVTWVR